MGLSVSRSRDPPGLSDTSLPELSPQEVGRRVQQCRGLCGEGSPLLSAAVEALGVGPEGCR